MLQNLIKPYRCVSLDFLAKEINVASEEVVSLLVQLILDEKIAAKIDGIEGFLQVTSGGGDKAKQFTGLQKWAGASAVHVNMLLGSI